MEALPSIATVNGPSLAGCGFGVAIVEDSSSGSDRFAPRLGPRGQASAESWGLSVDIQLCALPLAGLRRVVRTNPRIGERIFRGGNACGNCIARRSRLVNTPSFEVRALLKI